MNGTLKYTSKDAREKSITENLGTIKADDLFSDSSDTQIAFATELDNFAKSVNNLSTNTYAEATVEIKTSLNDIIQGGE